MWQRGSWFLALCLCLVGRASVLGSTQMIAGGGTFQLIDAMTQSGGALTISRHAVYFRVELKPGELEVNGTSMTSLLSVRETPGGVADYPEGFSDAMRGRRGQRCAGATHHARYPDPFLGAPLPPYRNHSLEMPTRWCPKAALAALSLQRHRRRGRASRAACRVRVAFIVCSYMHLPLTSVFAHFGFVQASGSQTRHTQLSRGGTS
jgi:hypothetical protein